jgi:hypothetical protein
VPKAEDLEASPAVNKGGKPIRIPWLARNRIGMDSPITLRGAYGDKSGLQGTLFRPFRRKQGGDSSVTGNAGRGIPKFWSIA